MIAADFFAIAADPGLSLPPTPSLLEVDCAITTSIACQRFPSSLSDSDRSWLEFSRSWLEFGPSQGSTLVLLRYSFAQVSRIARRRAEPHFDSVWASPNEVRRFRARVKNRRKIVPDTLLAQVTQQLICERRFFRVRTPQHGPQELSGASWDHSWGPLERCWITLGSLLGHSWGAHGRS